MLTKCHKGLKGTESHVQRCSIKKLFRKVSQKRKEKDLIWIPFLSLQLFQKNNSITGVFNEFCKTFWSKYFAEFLLKLTEKTEWKRSYRDRINGKYFYFTFIELYYCFCCYFIKKQSFCDFIQSGFIQVCWIIDKQFSNKFK